MLVAYRSKTRYHIKPTVHQATVIYVQITLMLFTSLLWPSKKLSGFAFFKTVQYLHNP